MPPPERYWYWTPPRMITTHYSSMFKNELSSLKAEGSSLLVVGTVPEEEFGKITRQLLGDTTEGPRRRLVVTSDDRVEKVRHRLPDEVTLPRRESTRIISVAEPARSAAATAETDGSDIPIERVSITDLSALGGRIQRAITEFEHAALDLEPAELRVSVDVFTSLLDTHGEETVFRLVHPLNNLVREKSGMIHYHLPLEYETATAQTFAPLFDGIIELRIAEDRLQQRWHLRDSDITSDWVEVVP